MPGHHASDFPDPAHPRHTALWHRVAGELPRGELAHDAAHIQRVYRWALHLAEEAGVDEDLAGAAALIHDLVFIPKNHPDRPLGGERAAAAAPPHLRQAGYNADEIAQLVEAVRTCSWSRALAPTAQLGRLLQDADRLDALGLIGLARTIACHQHFATAATPGAFYHPTDPTGADPQRQLDDTRYAFDHLRVKLLRLAAHMHLPSARAEADRRHAWLLAALAELEREFATGSTGAQPAVRRR
ncbi:MAG: HD domain-containing protein [Planctomycetota bacterium]